MVTGERARMLWSVSLSLSPALYVSVRRLTVDAIRTVAALPYELHPCGPPRHSFCSPSLYPNSLGVCWDVWPSYYKILPYK